MQPTFQVREAGVGRDDMGFNDLAIPERVRRILLQSVKHQRLPPVYLFVGPRGTGKTSTARIVARALSVSSTPISTWPNPRGR